MAKYSEDFKLSVVLSYEAGDGGYRALSQQFGLDHATVRRWVKFYQAHGVEGLRKKFSHYSVRFKLFVLQRIQQDELSVRQALVLFNIRGGVGVITEWKRLYHEQGLAGLQPKPRGLTQSMSRKGNCLDNAAMESFFGTLKSEFFYLNHLQSIDQLQAGIHQYIHYYNHERIRTELKGLSPVQYRNQALAT